MSRNHVVAKRYARALFSAAQDKQVIPQVESELRLIADTIRSSQEIQKFLSYPNFAAASKVAVFKEALGGTVSDLVLNTIGLLFERSRYDVLDELLEAYLKISGEAQGQADATAYTVYPLSETDKAEIEAAFSQLLNKKIRLDNVIDKSLLGGLKVRIGDRLYDGSLSGKLARLEKSLNQSQAL